jgi:type VI secretion system secreted protein VgrG
MLDQARRIAKLTTPLGENALVLKRLVAHERMSELFSFEIEAVSEEADINFDKILGQDCCVSMEAFQAGERYFHGMLTHAEWVGTRNNLHVYKLTLRPRLWMLGKTSDSRIHHSKDVISIIRDTFEGHHFSGWRDRTTYQYPVLHYTVQYRETDLNFVMRLMEQHGIYFYHQHTENEHLMILCDSRSSHNRPKGFTDVPFIPLDENKQRTRQQHLWSWNSVRDFRSGRVELNDYHHVTPNARLNAQFQGADQYRNSDMQVYEHPGVYTDQEHGELYARVRLEEEQSYDRRRQAEGAAVSLVPGGRITLTKHPRASENREYLIIGARQEFVAQDYRSGPQAELPESHGVYEFIPSERSFHAPFITKKPLIHSLHTALVVGAEGAEIDPDNHGRILVSFPWDRHGDRSCRMRVSQVWGGKGWGAQTIPRVGMRALVAYEDGDPDRPICVGTAPDPVNNKVPYALPWNKTKMVLRSDTHKGPGYHELTFEDEAGKENFFTHAQKDHTQKTRNNHTHRVDANSIHSVGANHSQQIANNMSHQIGGGLSQIIGLPPAANAAVDAASAATLTSDSGAGMAAGAASLAESVAGAVGPGILNQLITLMHNTVTGVAKTETIGVASNLLVGETSHEKVGQTKKVVVGNEFILEVGKSKLIMRKDGTVIILGTNFNFTASGPVQINGEVVDLNKQGGVA